MISQSMNWTHLKHDYYAIDAIILSGICNFFTIR